MKNKTVRKLLVSIIFLIFIDQITKFIIQKMYVSPIGNNLAGIELVYNTGMPLGFKDGNIRNIFLSVFVLIIIINFLRNQIERIDKKNIIALSLVISGGISNLIDRFLRGSVINFIKIIKIPNFNLADLFIVSGWFLLIIFLIDYTRKN